MTDVGQDVADADEGVEPDFGPQDLDDSGFGGPELDDAVDDALSMFTGKKQAKPDSDGEEDSEDQEAGEEDEGSPEDKKAAKSRDADKSAKGKDAEVGKEDKDATKAESRSEKRIKALVARQKEAQTQAQASAEKASKLERQIQEMGTYISSMTHKVQEREAEAQKQLAIVTKELEMVKAMRERQEEANLSPTEKFERDVIRKAHANISQEFGSKYSELEKKYADLEKATKQKEEEAARQQRVSKYIEEGSHTASKLLDGVDEKHAAKLRQALQTHTLGWAASFDLPVDKAGEEFDRFAHMYVLAKSKARSRKNGAVLEKGQKVPQSTPAGKQVGRGKARPTHAEAVKRGFSSVFDMMADQDLQ